MLCVRRSGESLVIRYFKQHSLALSTASWKILYSLVLAAAWCLAPHHRQNKQLPRVQPPRLKIGLPLSLSRSRLEIPRYRISWSTTNRTRKKDTLHPIAMDRTQSTPHIRRCGSCIHYHSCSAFPVLVVPEAVFLTILVMSFAALIKKPFPTFLVISVPATLKTPLPAPLAIPFPAFFEKLFPALLVAISLTSLR